MDTKKTITWVVFFLVISASISQGYSLDQKDAAIDALNNNQAISGKLVRSVRGKCAVIHC